MQVVIVILLALVLTMCGHGPTGPSDAGATHFVPGVAGPMPSALAGPPRGPLTRVSGTDKHRAAFLSAKQKDPRVSECEKTTAAAQDRGASLRDCLKPLEAPLEVPPGADARVRAVLASSRPPIHDPVWDVSFFLNSSTGNDSNTGTDSAHPLRTRGEEVARWGTRCPIRTVSVVDTITGDMPNSDPFTPCDIQFTGGAYEIAGTMTSVSTGTLSGVVPKNRGANQTLNVNLGSAAAGAVGLLIQNTRHSSFAIVRRIVSGNVVEVGQPMAPMTPTSFIPGTEVDTWTNGDAFTVWQPPKLSVQSALSNSGDFITNGTLFYHVWIQDASGSGLNQMVVNPITFFEESLIDPVTLSNQSLFSNVRFGPHSHLLVSDAAANGGTVIDACVVEGGFLSNAHDSDVGNDSIVNGASVFGEEAFGDIFLAGGLFVGGQGYFVSSGYSSSTYSDGTIYGTQTINVAAAGELVFSGTLGPATVFPGATLQQEGLAFAAAIDNTLSPAPHVTHVSLTTGNLAAPASSGGFGGIAYSADWQPRYVSSTALGTMAAPSTYVAPVANGGTANGSLCPTGQALVSNGSTYTCQAVAGGVSIPTCASGDFLQSTGTSYACIVSPLPTNVGGTGQTSVLANAMLVGSAGGNLTQKTCPAGFFLQWAGVGTVPSCEQISGDVSFPAGGPATVKGLEGNPMTASTPVDGQAWIWDATSVSYLLEKIPLASLAQSGATTGQVAGWNGSAWAPTTSAAFSCTSLGGCTGGQLPNTGMAPGGANKLLATNTSNTVTQWITLQGSTGISVSPIVSGAINITNTEPFTGNAGQAVGSGPITSSLTTIVSKSVSILSGQTAYLDGQAWIENTDACGYTVLLNINGANVGKTFVVGANNPANGNGEMTIQGSTTSTTVGTGTYNMQMAWTAQQGGGAGCNNFNPSAARATLTAIVQ